jgi:hypothetical protein
MGAQGAYGAAGIPFESQVYFSAGEGSEVEFAAEYIGDAKQRSGLILKKFHGYYRLIDP